jgi:hypothetical protein
MSVKYLAMNAKISSIVYAIQKMAADTTQLLLPQMAIGLVAF